MVAVGNDVARLVPPPTDERWRASKRIIPGTKVQAVRKSGPRRRHCPRAPAWLRPECPKSRAARQHWYADLLAEIGEEIIPQRRDRVNPRVIKPKIKKWPRKRPKHRQHPQPRKKIERSIVMLR